MVFQEFSMKLNNFNDSHWWDGGHLLPREISFLISIYRRDFSAGEVPDRYWQTKMTSCRAQASKQACYLVVLPDTDCFQQQQMPDQQLLRRVQHTHPYSPPLTTNMSDTPISIQHTTPMHWQPSVPTAGLFMAA